MNDIPQTLHTYLAMWNECNEEKMRALLQQCIAEDCLWVDPQNAHRGREALAENVRQFRAQFPSAELTLASNVDGHHGRFRYEWAITVNEELLIRGFDVCTLNADQEIERVDGFFGELQAN